ncbi:PepSY-associated TM helix domain-containing protein [Filomicrobium sp.]|uniref:PepSY-associated TM helix domain-containing protein n=1 Tax=Filomicrobium sp. TaxID=2024831 RepID=UPI0025836D57|nr:PepSY-associated TM helix domain-containing protein [Filomicrobium sp.]MCV0370489.1 PepSY-associated TM helix domain-containing protein [Filomicrobium sp.]
MKQLREFLHIGDRPFWLRHLHRWHWISAAISLVGMMLFAITGITLNHARQIEAGPQVTSREGTLPPALLKELATKEGEKERPLPDSVQDWLSRELSISVGERAAEWSEQEVYVSLPRPGGDAWLTIDRAQGAVLYEVTNRGWISYLNDLHKGRNAGLVWSLFIDAFAAACLIFCFTGLFLLQMHAVRRPSTWPMVGVGIAVPVAILLLFVH